MVKGDLNIGVSKNRGTPKSSILIEFSIIFTIHFGGFPPIFGNTHIGVSPGFGGLIFGPSLYNPDQPPENVSLELEGFIHG